jgi:hypothetical protein
MKTRHGLSAALFLSCLLAPFCFAEDGRFYGMLRQRDLTPFGFLRLDMRPAHAVSIEPGTIALELDVGYQNTWALSRDVEKYLNSLEPAGRRHLGPQEVAAIRALPGENYLVDLEAATVDLTMHYKLSRQWTFYATATAVSYHTGFMDSGIESFHDAFGFSTFGRPALARNDPNIIYALKGAQVTMLDAPDTTGMTDPVFGVRYMGFKPFGNWNISMELAAKVPLGGERLFLSTGRTDYGTQLSLRRLGSRNAFLMDVSAVYYAGEDQIVPQEARVVPTIVLGWERQLTARTNFNLQGYASRSVYTRDQTDLDELLNDKFQASLGVRHRLDCCVVSFAITENLQNLNNTPDVGFQLGFAWAPKLQP